MVGCGGQQCDYAADAVVGLVGVAALKQAKCFAKVVWATYNNHFSFPNIETDDEPIDCLRSRLTGCVFPRAGRADLQLYRPQRQHGIYSGSESR